MAEAKQVVIVAIDGPAGSGKTTLARGLAHRLGFTRVDTGALYRSAVVLAKRRGVDSTDEDGLARALADMELSFVTEGEENRVILEGDDVTEAIRRPEVSEAASRISAFPKVRAALLGQQRRLALESESPGAVLEGRDVGTVVFPDADFKFFLTASPRERARRRHLELLSKGVDVDLESVAADQAARDERDTSRAVSPLVRAPDAIVIDSTGRGPDEIIEELARIVLSAP